MTKAMRDRSTGEAVIGVRSFLMIPRTTTRIRIGFLERFYNKQKYTNLLLPDLILDRADVSAYSADPSRKHRVGSVGHIRRGFMIWRDSV